MTKQEDTRRKSRRDLLLILLILPFSVLCMFATGQVAIRLAPTWVLETNMFSILDPNSNFAGLGDLVLIEPLDPGILTQFPSSFLLTPGVEIPTRPVAENLTPIPPTQPPPPEFETPIRNPSPTATLGGPVIIPTTTSGIQESDLAITKSDSSNTYTPGTTISYTIVVTNNGPDGADGFNIVDIIPASISGLTVNCIGVGGYCGANTSSGNTVSFTDGGMIANPNARLTITVSGLVASGTLGNLSNTAVIQIPGSTIIEDYNLANNTATDTDTQFSIYDISITKDDGVDTYTATNPINYTIVVTNAGPSDAINISVTDNIPLQITSWSWTCVTPNPTCNGVMNSTANFADTVTITSGNSIEYNVSAIPSGVPQNVSNTASLVIPGGPGTIQDPNLANNTATDVDIPYIDLQITKTDNNATFTPGGTVDYTVTVTNNSTFNLTGIDVSDPIPAQFTSWDWTCVTPNPSCNGVTGSNASFTDTINLTAGSSQVYDVTANVSANPGLVNISNTASVSAPTGLVDQVPGNNSATETTPPSIDLAVTKDDGVATYTPGGTLTYTVTVTNNSGFALNGVTVTDNMPTLITSWSWTCGPNPPPPGATCAIASGTGSIVNNTVNLPANASVVYTINANIHPNAAGTLENTASVSPPAGLVDVDTSNNTATDSDANALGGPNIGPPDGAITTPAQGTTSTYFFSPAITNNGSNTPDFVFYERDTGTGIALDLVTIEISADGSSWTSVLNWGNDLDDTNSNVSLSIIGDGGNPGDPEFDDRPIPYANLYNNSGVTIDIDSLGLSGSYPWIRFICPTAGNTDGECDIDSIQPYYP